MKQKAIYLRSFIFGVEDSLVSTTGLLSGIASVGTPKETVLTAGLILIFVEALSMGAGSFLAEETAEEVTTGKQKVTVTIPAAIIMFLSYFFSGFIPLFPYLIMETTSALSVSIVLALIALFVLGTLSARHYGKSPTKSALRVLIIGGLAITVGVVVGNFANSLL